MEFVAILLGVLGAFYLTGWQQVQQELRLEKFYVEGLLRNLTADVEHMAQVINDQRLVYLTIDTLLHVTPEEVAADPDYINVLYRNARDNVTFFPAVGAYRAMVSQGALSVLRNKAVVDKLVKLYEHSYLRISNFGEVVDDQVTAITWEIRALYDMYNNQFFEPNAVLRADVQALLRHRHAYAQYYVNMSENALIELKDVLASLEVEAKKLNI